MVRCICFSVLLFAFGASAQVQSLTGYKIQKSEPIYRKTGTVSASATYVPGIMLSRDQTNYYVHGFAEYHFSRKVSIKSDSYWFLNSPNNSSDETILRSNFGMFYHLNGRPLGRWDVKLGLLPGITFYETRTQSNQGEVRSQGLAPSLNFAVGYDYFVWDYFHFFTQLTYVNSTIRGLDDGSKRMDELLFSVGLGFQIQTRKSH